MAANNAFSNEANVDLIMAAYLATDNYDYQPNSISATSLLKPIRQHVLSKRVPETEKTTDVTKVIKSRIGTSVHDGCLLYTSPSPRDRTRSRMPSSA